MGGKDIEAELPDITLNGIDYPHQKRARGAGSSVQVGLADTTLKESNMSKFKKQVEEATEIKLPDCFYCGDTGKIPYFRYNPNLDIYETGTDPCENCEIKYQQESDEINADIKGK